MVNFYPMKQYMFYLTKKLIKKYGIKGKFLDAGCGKGDVSRFLLENGFVKGKAIDSSDKAISVAKTKLSNLDIQIEKKDILKEKEKYDFIVLWDVLEHCENDQEILNHLKKLLNKEGYLLVSYPIKKREWRTDDHNYGHLRRYELHDIKDSFKDMNILEIWDFTFPSFWLMRIIYNLFTEKNINSQEQNTEDSSLRNFKKFRWLYPLAFINYPFKKLNLGHQSLVLARKVN